jgi:hypothetical protein
MLEFISSDYEVGVLGRWAVIDWKVVGEAA